MAVWYWEPWRTRCRVVLVVSAALLGWGCGSMRAAETEAPVETQPEGREQGAASVGGAVLAPWTPLERQGMVVLCWNRAYDFANGPIPRVKVAGEPIFTATGPQVTVKFPTGPAQRLAGPNQLEEFGGALTTFRGAAQLSQAAISWRSEIHYDGLVQIQLTLAPRGAEPLEVESLRIELPVRREQARYLRTPQVFGRPKEKVGSTEADWRHEGRRYWRQYFGQSGGAARRQPPYVWLGNAEKGVAWWAENDFNWSNRRGERLIAAEDVKENGSTTIRIDPITKLTSIDRPVTITFGIIATPSRPLTRGYRNFRVGVREAGAYWTYGWSSDYWRVGYTLGAFRGELPQVLKNWNELGWRPLPYSAMHHVAGQAPEYRQNQQEWSRTVKGEIQFLGEQRDGYVCPQSRGWSEFLLHHSRRIQREWRPYVHGMYLDTNSLATCDNPAHGDHLVDTFGRTIAPANWKVLAHRRLMQRLYAETQRNGLIFLTQQHDTGVAPVHSFSDYHLPGEDAHWAILANPWAYTDDFPLAYWQTLQSFGVPAVYLPQWGRAYKKQPKYVEDRAYTRSLIGLLAAHDLNLAVHYCHRKEAEAYLTTMKAWADAAFHPYWRQTRYRAPGLLVSYYEKPSGKRLVVYVNRSPKPVRYEKLTVPARDFVLVTEG